MSHSLRFPSVSDDIAADEVELYDALDLELGDDEVNDGPRFPSVSNDIASHRYGLIPFACHARDGRSPLRDAARSRGRYR